MTFWDFWAPFYNFAEMVNGAAYSKMTRAVKRFVPYGATVLDAACGTGNISLAVADKAWKVKGCDISRPMLAIARNAARARKIRNIRFASGDINRLNEKNSSYDIVTASMVLHLLDDPGAASAELRRVAKRRVIIPMPLTKRDDGKRGVIMALYKAAGFRPKRELDLRGFAGFLKEMGFGECRMIYIEGLVPMAVAVWEKKRKSRPGDREEGGADEQD